MSQEALDEQHDRLVLRPSWNRSPDNRANLARAFLLHPGRNGQPMCGVFLRKPSRLHGGRHCRNLAMANGRCRLHGGPTPRGAAWHRVKFPKETDPHRDYRLGWLLDRTARRRIQRIVALAAMAPDKRVQALRRSSAMSPPPRTAEQILAAARLEFLIMQRPDHPLYPGVAPVSLEAEMLEADRLAVYDLSLSRDIRARALIRLLDRLAVADPELAPTPDQRRCRFRFLTDWLATHDAPVDPFS
jgi:hypothetical protein